jgi:hypothetical protein
MAVRFKKAEENMKLLTEINKNFFTFPILPRGNGVVRGGLLGSNVVSGGHRWPQGVSGSLWGLLVALEGCGWPRVSQVALENRRWPRGS